MDTQAALLGVLVSIIIGAGVLVTEFVHKMKETTVQNATECVDDTVLWLWQQRSQPCVAGQDL